MKIELKNIKVSEFMSEETTAFSANLYVDGKHVAVASNHGTGGPTSYHPVNAEAIKTIRSAEDYCKKLPPEEHESAGQTYKLDMDLELYIDNLLTAHLEQKDLQRFRNKIDKAAVNGILYGVPDKSFQGIKLKLPIGTLLKQPNGPKQLGDLIRTKIIPELKDGDVILNQNIPVQVLKDAGLRSDQYSLKADQPSLKKEVRKSKGKGI